MDALFYEPAIMSEKSLLGWFCMVNTSCRYVINASGKSGEMYHTTCENKMEVKRWIEENQEKILADRIKVTDKKKRPFSGLLFFIK